MLIYLNNFVKLTKILKTTPFENFKGGLIGQLFLNRFNGQLA